MIGQKIGQYRVLDLIGRGAMGSVYRASDEMLAREVALKVLDTSSEAEPERFRTEAVALARISHPGIAAVYQLLNHNDQLIMVMELVRGWTLQQFTDQEGVLSPERAAEICMQTLAALTQAHAAGVVHRDLKPGNLMITAGDAIKITDFGIARLEGTAHVTRAGVTMGTPAYMAPEQIQGRPVDARADLYSMGVVFYRLVTGALPFRADSEFAMVQAQLNDAPTPAASVRSDLPAWVDEIVTRALAKDPDQRFQSASDFHEGLAACLAGGALPSAYCADGNTEPIPVPVETRSTVPADPETPALPASVAAPAPRRAQHPIDTWLTWLTAAAAVGAVALWAGAGPSPADLAEKSQLVMPIAADASSSVPAPPRVPVKASLVTKVAQGTITKGNTARDTRPPRVAAPSNANVDAFAIFGNIKLVVVTGDRSNDRDVMLRFAHGQIATLPPGGGEPIAGLPYGQIVKATYTRGREPRWDPSLSAPPDGVSVSGFLGRTRNWLVVQTKSSYTILRLDGPEWSSVLHNLEARTGLTVERPGAFEK